MSRSDRGHPRLERCERCHGFWDEPTNCPESSEVLVCRLVGGKITFVHRRLWPALVRAASHFSAQQLERAGQQHTVLGYHVACNLAFPNWVPQEVTEQARLLSEQEAVDALGSWVGGAQQDALEDDPAAASRPPSRR